MIPALLTIALAFTWLLLETQYLTIRLPYGKASPEIDDALTLRINAKSMLDYDLSIAGLPKPLPIESKPPTLLLDTYHNKPSEFTQLDIPDTTGTLNINCKRC